MKTLPAGKAVCFKMGKGVGRAVSMGRVVHLPQGWPPTCLRGDFVLWAAEPQEIELVF